MDIREAYYSLPQAYGAFQLAKKKEGFYKQDVGTAAAVGVTGLVLFLIVLQIALVCFAIYALIKCSHILPTWAIVLLAIGMFMPWIGGAIALGIIIYYFVECKGKGEAFYF